MPITERELAAIRRETTDLRNQAAGLSTTIRSQAAEIRAIGNRLDAIFTRVREAGGSSSAIPQAEFRELRQALNEIQRTADQLSRRGNNDNRGS